MAIGVLILFLLALLGASAFFSASETAFFSLPRETILELKNSSHSSANLVAELIEKPRELLSTILFGNLVVNILFYSVTALKAYKMAESGRGAAAALISVGGLAAVIIFGEVVPKAAAFNHRRALAQFFAPPLFLVYALHRDMSPYPPSAS